MSFYTNSKVFYVNSRDRVSGNDTNFSCILNIPPDSGYNKVCLLQASIPKSFYNFPTGQNTFILQELGVNYTVTIPFGSYNVNNLSSILSSVLTSTSPNGWKYSISFPSASQSNTGLFTFTVSNNTGQPSFIFSNSCYQQLGFASNSTNTFSTNTLTSVNYITLSTVNRVFIKSSMCQSADGTILQEILQTFPDNSYIYFQQFDILANSKDFTSSSNQVFEYIATDGEGNEIYTNGINVQMSILAYTLDDINELNRQNIIISNLERIYNLEEKLSQIFIKK